MFKIVQKLGQDHLSFVEFVVVHFEYNYNDIDLKIQRFFFKMRLNYFN